MDTTANTTASPARDVTADRFDAEVVEASRNQPVVVDFWAPWCGPCHQLSPIIERVAARHPDVTLVKVNVDEAPQLSQRYRVQGIPAVKAFSGGEVVAEFTGVQPEQAVDRFFAGLAPSPADRLVDRAATEPTEAEGLLREALEHDAGHAGANVALARRLIDRGDVDEARVLLARVPGDADAKRLLAQLNLAADGAGDDIEALQAEAETGAPQAQLRLGRALAAAGRHGEALPWLVAAVAHPDTREEARSSALEVFALLGDDHELVRLWRPKLAAALF